MSGGGVKGFAHIGAIEVLTERGLLKAVKEYLGISAGALCAMCICVGLSLPDIRQIVAKLDFGLIQDINPETALNFPDTFGMDSGANIAKLIGAILKAKGLSPSITFKELADKKIGPNLRVFATNMNRCMAQEFSAAASPDSEIRFAVQASMSIPIYFTPLKDPRSGDLFLDGGIMCPSPLHYLTYEEQIHTLAIAFADNHKPRAVIGSLSEFIFQLYYSIDYESSLELKRKWKGNTIVIDCGHITGIEFELDMESKIKIIDAGRCAAAAFIKTPGQRPVRRFSVV